MTRMADFRPQHFNWSMHGDVAVINLARPERKNPLTFESDAELRDTFRALAYADDVKAIVIASNGGNFCSGGDVHDIIAPLLERDALFSDLRLGSPDAKTAFLFTHVGHAGCDMGACAMLPRVIGQGRAAELLYTGPPCRPKKVSAGFF